MTTLLTLKQAAERCGLAPVSLRQAIALGRLQGQRVGRDWLITPAALEAYLSSRPAWFHRRENRIRVAEHIRTLLAVRQLEPDQVDERAGHRVGITRQVLALARDYRTGEREDVARVLGTTPDRLRPIWRR